MNFIFPTQYVIHRSLKVKWCLSEWISDLKSCSSTLFDSFVTLLTTLPFPSFAGKGPFLSSFHRIHPNLSRFVSHLGAISDIRVLRSGLRPRSCASSGTRRSGMRCWAASVEVDMDQLCLVLLWFLFGPIVQYVLIVDIMFKFLFCWVSMWFIQKNKVVLFASSLAQSFGSALHLWCFHFDDWRSTHQLQPWSPGSWPRRDEKMRFFASSISF